MTQKYECHIDEFGDTFYSKKINIELNFCSYDAKKMEEDVENSIFYVLNDCAFDDIGWFEKVNKND